MKMWKTKRKKKSLFFSFLYPDRLLSQTFNAWGKKTTSWKTCLIKSVYVKYIYKKMKTTI